MKKIISLITLILPTIIYCQNIDTLDVRQNDTCVFKKINFISTRPCRNPEFTTRYDLKKPLDNTYYIIRNDKNQIIKKGTYKKENIIGDTTSSGFYDLKYFYYKNNKLITIYYTEEGRHSKTEFYDGRDMLESISYFNKKTTEGEKVEFYKNNKLVETKYYTHYYGDKYYSIIVCESCGEKYNKKNTFCTKCNKLNTYFRNQIIKYTLILILILICFRIYYVKRK